MMNKNNGPLWLDIIIGLFAAILCSAGATLLLGIIGPYYDLPFVEQTLTGALSVGVALALFFGLRSLARMGFRGTGHIGFALDIAIGLIVVVLWLSGIQLIFESSVDFSIRIVRRTVVGMAMLGITLGLFFGLRALAGKLLSPKRQ